MPRALDLVGYLVNLKTAFDYPEAVPYVAPRGRRGGGAQGGPGSRRQAAPAKGTPAPAAAASPPRRFDPRPRRPLRRSPPARPHPCRPLRSSPALSPTPAPANSGAKTMSDQAPNDPRLDQAAVSDESLIDAHEKELSRHPTTAAITGCCRSASFLS